MGDCMHLDNERFCRIAIRQAKHHAMMMLANIEKGRRTELSNQPAGSGLGAYMLKATVAARQRL